MLKPTHRRLISIFSLGLMVGCGSSGKSSQGGGTGGATSVAGSGGGAGASNGGSSGQTGNGGQTSNGGQTGSGGQAGGAGQTDSGGQTDSASQTPDAEPVHIDGSAADAAQGSDAAPSPDAPPKMDAPVPFWPQAFVAKCTPPAIDGRPQTDGYHRAGEDCMTSGCHSNPTQGVPGFLFGGTIYRAGTATGDSAVQVGVRTPGGFYSACSATNGNFWYISDSNTSSLVWSTAAVRVRNAGGESAMMTAVAGGCNASLCHDSAFRLLSPL
jgi:hypothetical protein